MNDPQAQDLIGDKPYLTCEAHMEDLALVCLEGKCKNRLICGLCEEQGHQGHKVTGLRTFFSELKFNEEA